MSQVPNLRSREAVFDFLDDYAYQRRQEIDRHQLGEGRGLIKSYVVETSPHNPTIAETVKALRGTGWDLAPIEDDRLYSVQDNNGELGYIEPVSPRYWALHTYRQTSKADPAIQRTVRETPQLDSLWLSGDYFTALWKTLILPQFPYRSITFKFEHRARFEPNGVPESDDFDENQEEDIEEQPASISSITERASRIATFLPDLQKVHPPFKAIRMMRIPADKSPGGYEFWSWGKVTYRSDDFREGREQVFSITRLYSRLTEAIEQKLWLSFERINHTDGEALAITGAPLTLEFSKPLSNEIYNNLLDVTFENSQGPLRLWGNPIRLSANRAHVYGVDMHLWQRIYLDITPYRIVAILPRGTCGNTAHRLLTNVQRFVDPGVKMWIGDTGYDELVRGTLLGRDG
jgi:hypothetical protein